MFWGLLSLILSCGFLFTQSQKVSSHMYTGKYSIEDSTEILYGTPDSPTLELFPANSSCLNSLPSQFLHNWGAPPGSSWVFPPCALIWKVFHISKWGKSEFSCCVPISQNHYVVSQTMFENKCFLYFVQFLLVSSRRLYSVQGTSSRLKIEIAFTNFQTQ